MHKQHMHVHVSVRACPPHSPLPPRTGTPASWGALIVLCGVLFLDALDVSMVGVALPSIEADLGLSTSQLQWIVSGYVLGYGGLLLLGGRAADLLGRRRVFLVALAVFAVASLLGGSSTTGPCSSPPASSRAWPRRSPRLPGCPSSPRRSPKARRATGRCASTPTGASGFSLGLVLGGLLTEVGWRWTFLLPVPVAIALLVAAPR